MLKKYFNKWLSWSDEPYLKTYRGIGSKEICLVHGHLFKGLSLQREKPSKRFFSNAREMLKRFMVSPFHDQEVKIILGDKVTTVKTDETGYFYLSIPHDLNKGWHQYKVRYSSEGRKIQRKGEILIADPESIIVSDIDDTILVSHSTSILKKLYLLLSRNSEQRKPFKGIVDSYRQLEKSEILFVFVSSSEWNLYDFIIGFCEYYDFPKGVYFLQDIKKWKDLFRSGGGDHSHKKQKIEILMELFPDTKFHLVGDSGQKDPVIYAQLAKEHKNTVESIHIRDIRKKKAKRINHILNGIPGSTKSELFKDIPDFSFLQ